MMGKGSVLAARQSTHARWHHLLLWSSLLALCSCGVEPTVDSDSDGAPQQRIDVSMIADAVPRYEPHSKYGNPRSYTVAGERYTVMNDSRGYVERGIASWYGTKFHGRRTSSGEPYDLYAMTAAHKTLPIPCYARVTNLRNHRSVVVRINDRGPFVKDRLIDLSYAAATKLGIVATGTGLVEVRTIDPRHPQEIVRTPAPESVPAARDTGSQLFVQVGAFADRSNAERLRQRLLSVPLDPVEIQEFVTGNQSLYRVRVGPLDDVSAADRMTEKLSQLGLGNTHIVVD